MRSYARYWLEAFRLPVMPAGRLAGGCATPGMSGPRSSTWRPGGGVVFALPHMGNYDLAGAWVIAKGAGSLTTVAERLKPESVYDRFVAFRAGLGVEVLPVAACLAQRLHRRLMGGVVHADSEHERHRHRAGRRGQALSGPGRDAAAVWFCGGVCLAVGLG